MGSVHEHGNCLHWILTIDGEDCTNGIWSYSFGRLRVLQFRNQLGNRREPYGEKGGHRGKLVRWKPDRSSASKMSGVRLGSNRTNGPFKTELSICPYSRQISAGNQSNIFCSGHSGQSPSVKPGSRSTSNAASSVGNGSSWSTGSAFSSSRSVAGIPSQRSFHDCADWIAEYIAARRPASVQGQ